MPSFDIVFGLDNATLNTEIAEFYKAVYPNLLKHEVSVEHLNIASIGFDVQVAPTASLTPSAAARAHMEQVLANPAGELAAVGQLSPEAHAAITEAAVNASFDLSSPQVEFTVNYSDGASPTIVSGAVTATLSVQTSTDSSGKNYLTLQALTGTISVSSSPVLAELLNNIAITPLLEYLNTDILTPFEVSALQLNSLTISMPVPVVQNGYLLAFSALGATQPDVPGASTWPSGTVFVGSDAAVLVAAANTVLPVGPSTGFNWEVISGTAGATVGPVGTGGVTINGDGSLTIQVPCNAEAQLTVHTPSVLPNFTFGPTATAVLSATGTPAVVNGELQVTINSVNPPSFDFSWGDIPFWIMPILNPLFAGLATALGAVLAPLVTAALGGKTFSVLTLPTPEVSLDGSSYRLAITQASTSGSPGPQGELLLVKGQPSFTPAA